MRTPSRPATICNALATQDTIWERAPHTAAKHSILRRYLEAWFPKLAWTGRVVFIDGFAGPGEYKGGEEGSPLIALKAAIEHQHNLSNCELWYIFIEQDKKRFEHLDGLLSRTELPNHVHWRATHAEFSDEFGGILDQLEEKGSNLAPAFIMLDPFGWNGMPYSIIERAAKYPRVEFLISFMYESIARWRNHPDHEETFDALFGCQEWRHADELSSPDERKEYLVNLYQQQLQRAGMRYVRRFEMIDEGGRTEYFLIYATKSLDGLRAMKAAMWKEDPSGSFQFSDVTAGRPTLFTLEPDYVQLKELIVDHFKNRGDFTDAQLELFVLTETPFRESHYKKQILRPMENSGELEVVRSPRRRGWGYPPGTVMRIE